jgi:hypothetical protein
MCERLGRMRSEDLILPASRRIQRGGPSLCTPRGSAAHQLDARESSQLVAQLRWCGEEQRAERVNRLSASFNRCDPHDAQDADHFDDVVTALGRRRCLTRQNRPLCCLGVGRIRFALATARLAVSAHHLDHADVLRPGGRRGRLRNSHSPRRRRRQLRRSSPHRSAAARTRPLSLRSRTARASAR